MAHSAGKDGAQWSASARNELYKTGLAQLAAREFHNAINSLCKAALRCKCYRDLSATSDDNGLQLHHVSDRCSRSVIELSVALRNGSPEDIYRFASKKGAACPCGCVFLQCNSDTHLAILDSLSQAHESTQNRIRALMVSALMIRLDPTSPLGYCRLAKVLRYAVVVRPSQADNNQLGHQVVKNFLSLTVSKNKDELNELLCTVVNKGARIVEEFGPETRSTGSKFALLTSLASKLKPKLSFGVDRIAILPAEVRNMIFSRLDFTSQLKCLTVSKTWNAVLQDEFFWRQVVINKPNYVKVRFDVFLRRHPHIRELVFRDISNFALSPKWIAQVLESLKDLETLRLRSPNPLQKRVLFHEFLAAPVIPNALKRLSLVNPGPTNTHLVGWILRHVRPTLEELCISGSLYTVMDIFGISQSPWRLKTLRFDLSTDRQQAGIPQTIDMERLVSLTPELEQLFIDSCLLSGPPIATLPSHEAFRAGWGKLRVLVLGAEACVLPDCVALPWLNDGMRVVELLIEDSWTAHKVLFELHPDAEPVARERVPDPETVTRSVSWPLLTKFRCRARIYSNAWLQDVVGPAIRAGNLRYLDLCVNFNIRMILPMVMSLSESAGNNVVPLPAEDWKFTFSNQITTLGLRDFAWDDSRDYYSSFNPQPFLAYLQHFPAVHTVHVYPGAKANTLALITGIMRTSPEIRTIYQDCLDSREWFTAKGEADRRGVVLHHKYKEYAPVVFPYLDNWSQNDAASDGV